MKLTSKIYFGIVSAIFLLVALNCLESNLREFIFDLIILSSALISFIMLLSLEIKLLNIGYGLLIISFSIDMIDEFVKIPSIIEDDLEGLMLSLGLLVITYGFYLATKNQKRMVERLQHALIHDPLTDLYNRTAFEDKIKHLDNKNNYPLSVIMIDINGLKLMNDIMGHYNGDMLIKLTANILTNSCDEKDLVFRWGGDEFFVILPKTDLHAASLVAKKIKIACNDLITLENHFKVSLAIGIASKTNEDYELKKVIKEAEDEMYRHKLNDKNSFHNTFVISLENLLKEKSFETSEHTRRLEKLAISVGQKMELEESQVNDIAILASLHDIGKIAIPESIIKKPGSLTEEEWQSIKKHPEIGYRICKVIYGLEPIAYGILSHHERWDGTGYPTGLKANDIPLISRIISVVDAYDVITNGRPYKTPVSPEEALAELKKCSGHQFDPEVVLAFEAVLTDQRIIKLGD